MIVLLPFLLLGHVHLDGAMALQALRPYATKCADEYARASACLRTYQASGLLTECRTLFVVSYSRHVCNVHACLWHATPTHDVFGALRVFLEDHGYFCNPMFRDDPARLLWDLSMYEECVDQTCGEETEEP